MESLKTAISALWYGCYMASLDLADAYYTIKISEQDRKYFRFIYQFTALVMEYSCCLRLDKDPETSICLSKVISLCVSVYLIDDSWLFGVNYLNCLENEMDTVRLMDYLGLTIN